MCTQYSLLTSPTYLSYFKKKRKNAAKTNALNPRREWRKEKKSNFLSPPWTALHKFMESFRFFAMNICQTFWQEHCYFCVGYDWSWSSDNLKFLPVYEKISNTTTVLLRRTILQGFIAVDLSWLGKSFRHRHKNSWNMYFDVNGCKVETSHMSKQHIKTPKHSAKGKWREKNEPNYAPTRKRMFQTFRMEAL